MATPDDELHRTAQFVQDVSRSTRSRLRLFSFPMQAFGAVMLGAAVFAIVVDPTRLPLYWMTAGTAAGLATARHYRTRELTMGLETSATPYLLAAGFLGAGAFSLPIVMDSDPAWAISVWTGLGYALFALIERSTIVAGVAATFVVLGMAFRVLDLPNEIAWVSGLSGTVLLAAASLMSRQSEFA